MKRAQKKKGERLEVAIGETGKWHWRLRAANNEIKFSTENYHSKSNAKRAARAEAKSRGLAEPIIVK